MYNNLKYNEMNKVSVFEAIGALARLNPETSEDYDNLEIVRNYLEQQREKQFKIR